MTILQTEQLSVGYRAPILRDLALDIGPGEIVGLLGPNGCGKTTLLRTLTGALPPLRGTVLLEGRDSRSMSPRRRAQILALLSQGSQPMEGLRVGEVIAMGRYPYRDRLGGPESAADALARQAARQLGILTLWDQDCSTLSEGQRQLVHLARVTAQDPRLFLLDEPNSALDFSHSRLLLRHLHRLIRESGKAALIVLHDPVLALHSCHRLLRVDQGTITGSLCPSRSSPNQIQAFLQPVFPGIQIRQDPDSGSFYALAAPEL